VFDAHPYLIAQVVLLPIVSAIADRPLPNIYLTSRFY
jgi:hypothetical protein